jgi:hypothetical protein
MQLHPLDQTSRSLSPKDAPHEMPFTIQKEIGCIIGKHHPPPMVDRTYTAAMYKRMFYRVKEHSLTGAIFFYF